MPVVRGAARFSRAALILNILILLMMPLAASGQGRDSLTLTPDESRVVAAQALDAGNAALARALCLALLERDPADVTAALLLAEAEDRLGHHQAARDAATRAWRIAKTDRDRFDAARLRALADYHDGRLVTAQWWLRRAMQAAPNDAARLAAAANFRSVRAQNPLRLQFSVAAQPSSNVNNGSSNTTMELLGIPFTLSGESRALSGTEIALGFGARYLLPPGAASQTELRFAATGRAYQLSDKAKAQAPNARGSDYAFAAVEIGAQRRWKLAGGKGMWSAGATLGRNWYGGTKLSDYGRLELGVERALSPRSAVDVRLSLERQRRADSATRSATVREIRGGFSRRLANGDGLRFGLGVRESQSASADIDHRATIASIDWTRGKPVAGMRLDAGLSFEWRDYPFSRFTTDGRQDKKLQLDIGVLFENVDYMGFAPRLGLRAGRTSSNVNLYETEDLGLTLGIQSKF